MQHLRGDTTLLGCTRQDSFLVVVVVVVFGLKRGHWGGSTSTFSCESKDAVTSTGWDRRDETCVPDTATLPNAASGSELGSTTWKKVEPTLNRSPVRRGNLREGCPSGESLSHVRFVEHTGHLEQSPGPRLAAPSPYTLERKTALPHKHGCEKNPKSMEGGMSPEREET